MEKPHTTERQRGLVDRSSRLIEFLIANLKSSQSNMRTMEQYPVTLRFDGAPTEIEKSINANAEHGDVVLSVPKVSFRAPPRVPMQFQRYTLHLKLDNSSVQQITLQSNDDEDLAELNTSPGWVQYQSAWNTWAEMDRKLKIVASWYDQLDRSRKRLEAESDSFELLLSVGRLTWQTDESYVDHPMFVMRCNVVLDKKTARLDIQLDNNSSVRLVDRPILEGIGGYHFGRTLGVREDLRVGSPAILSASMRQMVQTWLELAVERHEEFSETAVDTPLLPNVARISFSPTLIYRPRDKSNLIEFYESIAQDLSGDEVSLPIGLAEMVEALGNEEREVWLRNEGLVHGDAIGSDPLFPLPSNPEQRQIIDRLRFENGVVVQGPPGTGKTHTIANLLTALLARGQRVLVTSQKDQALRVLRDKLPEDIQDLCISSTNLKRGGSPELDRGITAISDRHSRFFAKSHAEELEQKVRQRKLALENEKKCKEELRALRETETYVHPEIAPGYQGTKSRIVARILKHEDSFTWLPLPFPEGVGAIPPLSAAELSELRGLLKSETSAREQRVHQEFVSLEDLPNPNQIEALMAAEQLASELAAELESEESTLIQELSGASQEIISSFVDSALRILVALGLRRRESTEQRAWIENAVESSIARSKFGAWQQLAEIATNARVSFANLKQLGTTIVTLPDFPDSGPESFTALLETARRLSLQVKSGKSLRPKFLRTNLEKSGALFLDQVLVNGHSVASNVTNIEHAINYMTIISEVNLLTTRWSNLGVSLEESSPLEVRLGQLMEYAIQLEQVMQLSIRCEALNQTLIANGYPRTIDSIADLESFARVLEAVKSAKEAIDAQAAILKQVESLDRYAQQSHAPPEVSLMHKALTERNLFDFKSACESFRKGPEERDTQLRLIELWKRLVDVYPALGLTLRETIDSDEWNTRFANIEEAWAYGVAWTFIEKDRNPDKDAQLASDLEQASRAVLRTTGEEAACRAWGERLPKMTPEEVSALKSYRAAISSYGKGTGKWADRYAADARQAMEIARSAVPAWIMPIGQVAELIKPNKYAFDVVIVDEASQADISSMFLLWLAPRIIVVGDDRQCAPVAINKGGNQVIFDRLDEYLYDMPGYLRSTLTPNSNLFTLLATRFPSVIRLREHFRCMPEIITWSSRQFYADEPLIPLRQFGSDRLPPLQTRHVENGVAEGVSTRMINEEEALAIVREIRACIDNPKYDKKSIGVIVLQSASQANVIDKLIQELIPLEEIEGRRIRVGTPPDFQGDERDVIFLSLVVSEKAQAVTAKDWQRRYNVAASRARDQMWIFHSVTPDQLSPSDLRRNLLSYMMNPPAPMTSRSYPDLRWDSDLVDPFESKFEQRVFIELRDRGYTITPQFEINGKRIDLLVTGANGQLAVECDGDFWHSAPEDVQRDIDRELELQRAGMKFWRVRESEFYRDPVKALRSLWIALAERGIMPSSTGGSPSSSLERSEQWESATLSNEEGLDGIEGGIEELDFFASR